MCWCLWYFYMLRSNFVCFILSVTVYFYNIWYLIKPWVVVATGSLAYWTYWRQISCQLNHDSLKYLIRLYHFFHCSLPRAKTAILAILTFSARYERSIEEPVLLEEAIQKYLPITSTNLVYIDVQSHYWNLLTLLLDSGVLYVSITCTTSQFSSCVQICFRIDGVLKNV